MKKTPKSLRLHIGLFGRMNVGKSSFLNFIAGQDVAITSPIPGTTTDVVEKPMELLPLGPVVFLDTAGMDDESALSGARIKRAKKMYGRSDIALLITEPDAWTSFEEEILQEADREKIPFIIVINKTDTKKPSDDFLRRLKEKSGRIIACSSIDAGSREEAVNLLKEYLLEVCPEEFLHPPPLIGDLLPSGGLAVLIVPIDLQAPKGRLILPQVQTIRDALDNDSSVLIVKEREYASVYENLRKLPDIVVCDSQVVLKMVADTPKSVKCTTFSILFSRSKGDLVEAARSAAVISTLKAGDKVLIAEACSHHAIEDDIGRVKIPRWLHQYAGAELQIDVSTGTDYPENLKEYKLIIHCGACMLTRKQMLARIQKAKEAGVPVTNYGVAISFLQGALERVLSPFPAALDAYKRERTTTKSEVTDECQSR